MRERSAFVVAVVASLALAGVLMWPKLSQDSGSAEPAAASASASALRTRAAAGGGPASSTSTASASASSVGPTTGDAGVPHYVRIAPESARLCPPDMLLVDGVFCPYVAHFCVDHMDDDETRCRRFRDDLICEGRPSALHFCIDRYEYPNMAGVLPAVMVSYQEAEQACTMEGKRLCEAEEWTLACEGTDTWPYPYGLDRDPSACNIDREPLAPDLRAFSQPHAISVEVERLDRRAASGALSQCVSPFGVHDMTGNVDEWVHNREGKPHIKPYDTSLKGGYWGPSRARCRPKNSSHTSWFRFYQVGFRCCRDAADGKPARTLKREGFRLPRRRKIRAPRKVAPGL